jgi:uncharacterized protein (TIGR00251 family)
MKIIVKVKTNAKEEKVERVSQATLALFGLQKDMEIYKVSVKEPPVDGKANTAIIKALAKYFETSPSCVTLISGQTSKQKVFEII